MCRVATFHLESSTRACGPRSRCTPRDARYCVWDEAHGDCVYTDAWIRKLTTELADRERFREVIGHDPIPLPDTQTELAPSQDARDI